MKKEKKTVSKKRKVQLSLMSFFLAMILLVGSGVSLFVRANEAPEASIGEVLPESSSVNTDSESQDGEAETSDSKISSEITSSEVTSLEQKVDSDSQITSSEVESEVDSDLLEEVIPPAVFAETDDTVTVTAANFLEYFSVNGNASFDSSTGVITLTKDELTQAGTATLKVKISQKQSFNLTGEINLGSKANSAGADGIAVGFHTGDTAQVGNTGAGLGVASLPKSFGVKWDTYYNGGDPLHNAFITLYYTNPSTPSSTNYYGTVGGANGPQTISEPSANRFVPFSIIYDGSTNIYTVTYSDPTLGTITKSAKISDLQTNLEENDPLTLIMSAGTGSRSNLQQIKSLNFQFTPVGVINEYYIDESGATLYTKKQSSASVPAIKGETLALSYQNGLTDQPYLDGYDYVKSTKSGITGETYSQATIPFTNGEQSVYHIFKKGIGKVNYISKNLQGEILVANQTTTGNFHTSYSITPSTISGYTYIGLDAGSAGLTGRLGKVDQTVTMLYGKNLVVQFNPNGGSAVGSINVVEGKTITAPTSPTKTGYVFAGWFIDEDLLQEMDFSSAITQNMTLYAKWSKINYTVVFNGNTNTGGSMATQEFAYDTDQALLANAFTKDGYHFSSWNTKSDGTGIGFSDQQSVKNLSSVNNGTVTLYCQWEPNKYEIVFDGNRMTSGSMPNQSFTYNVAQSLNANSFDKKGYTFSKWTTNEDGTGMSYSDGESVLNLTADNSKKITLYAQWTANEYTVNFNGNGETAGTMSSQNFVYDDEKELDINTYKKDGYTFMGWNTQADGKGSSFNDQSIVKNLKDGKNDSITLYAQWKVNGYAVAFKGNGSTDSPMANQSFKFDEDQALSKNTYTKIGYVFKNWNTKEDGSGTTYTDEQIVKNLTIVDLGTVNLYAQWTPNNYTVTFDENKATSGSMADQTFTYDQESKLNKSQYSRNGYTFIGWNDKANGKGTDYIDEDIVENLVSSENGNIKLYAQWSPNAQSIKFNANGGTTSQNEIVEGTGETVDLSNIKVASLDGYTFDGWWDASVGGNPMPSSLEMPVGGTTYFAQWKANEYDVIFDGNDSTLGAMPVQKYTYDIAQDLEQNEYKKTGYLFGGWSTKKNGDGPTFSDKQNVRNLTIEQNGTVTLYAQWEPIYYHIRFNGNGFTSGSMDDQKFEYDKNEELRGNEFLKLGYQFAGWNTQADGFGTSYSNQQEVLNLCPVNNSVITLYAQWTPNSYFVKFDGNTSTNGAMNTQTIRYDENTTLTENAFTKDGHNFGGWNTAADGSGTNYSDSGSVFNLTNNHNETVTFYAQWSVRNYTLQFDAQGGDTTPAEQSVTYATKASKPDADPSKYGHIFSGWDRQAGGGSLWDFDKDVMPSHDTTLYAQYTPNPHAVTFDYNGGGENQKQSVAFGQKVLEPETPRLFGYAFTGWYDENGVLWSFSTPMPDQDITLTAQWYHVEYTLTYLTYDLNSISSYVLYAGDEMPTETASNVPGHYFVGWGIDGTNGDRWDFNKDKTMPEMNLKLVAFYDKDQHTDSSSNSGSNSRSNSGTYSRNSANSSNTGSSSNSVSTSSISTSSISTSSSEQSTSPSSSISSKSSSSSTAVTSNPISSDSTSPTTTSESWSLLSLILTIIGGVLGVISVVLVFKKKKELSRRIFALINIALGIIVLIVFLLITDFNSKMWFINNQTFIYVLSVLFQVILFLFSLGKKKKDTEDAEDAEETDS